MVELFANSGDQTPHSSLHGLLITLLWVARLQCVKDIQNNNIIILIKEYTLHSVCEYICSEIKTYFCL